MNAQSHRDGRVLRILLYTLIPAESEFLPVKRSPLVFLRNRLRRFLELLAWRITGIWRVHYSTFEDCLNTNRGDIAIRLGVECQLQHALAGRALRIDQVAWNDLGPAIARADEPYDLIVIAGGGYLFADRNGRLPRRFAADVAALQTTAAPAVAVSIGLNHLIETGNGASEFHFHEDQRPLIRQFLHRVGLISVRDEGTRRALGAIGAPPPVVIDPAFLLVSTFDVERRRDRTRNTTGSTLAVGLNVAFHGAHATIVNRRLLATMIHVLQRFNASQPCRFFYFVHSNSEHGIVDALRLYGLSVEVIESDVDTMLAAYKRLDIHIGQMLHSAIFAMSVGVPTLAVAYDIKSRGFFSMFGLDHLCLDATTIDRDTLLHALTELAESRHRTAATIVTRGAALRTNAVAFYKELSDMVLHGPDGNAAECSADQETRSSPGQSA